MLSSLSPLRTRLATREEIRRLHESPSPRCTRQPVTASQRSRWPISVGMSCGSFCRSASIVTTHLPRAALNPASVAAVSPALALSRTSRTRGSASRKPRISSALRSRLPSSTKTISNVRPSGSSTERSSGHRIGRFCSSSYTGTTTERSTTSGPAAATMPTLPLADQRLRQLQTVEHASDRVVDHVIEILGTVVERRHRRQDHGADLGQRGQYPKVAEVQRALAHHQDERPPFLQGHVG